MKKLICSALSLCLVFAAAALTACGSSNEMSDKEYLSSDYSRSEDVSQTYNYLDGASEPPSSYNSYASEITDFELKMFRNYAESEKSETFAFAPINSVMQLGLAANAASGDTQDEIVNALGDDLTLDIINQCSSYFKSRIMSVADIDSENSYSLTEESSSSSLSYVKLSDNLFFNDSISVKSDFLQLNSDYYDADIYRVLFSNENASSKVSSCFTYYSDEAFRALDSSQKMFSVTAADICDTWLCQYAETDITQGDFTSGEKKATVNYMSSAESYMHTDSACGIVKYTANTPLKLLIIMPDEDISLDDYISGFTYSEYSDLLSNIDVTSKTAALIPQFSIGSDGKPESVCEVLEKSGLYTLFTEEASFSNLTSSNSTVFDEMYEISPKITVNAAGIGGIQTNTAKEILGEHTEDEQKTNSEVIFNRPFIFMVIDNESSIPLYIGTVDLTE